MDLTRIIYLENGSDDLDKVLYLDKISICLLWKKTQTLYILSEKHQAKFGCPGNASLT